MLRFLAVTTLSAFVPVAFALSRLSAEEFLSELYRAEAERVAHTQTLSNPELLALFTPRIAEILSAAIAHPDPAMRQERAPNALFGWGIVPGAELRLIGVSTVLGARNAPTLLVDVRVSGVPRRIVVDLVEDEGSWRIASIIYDAGEDFLSFEKRLARR